MASSEASAEARRLSCPGQLCVARNSAMAASISEGDFVALPKAELHSHLHGTIRSATLLELLAEHAPEHLPPPDADGPSAGAGAAAAAPPALAACFATFARIHRAVCTPAAVARVAREAVEDAAADGVRYLELRTTPRVLQHSGSSGARGEDDALDAYVGAVAEGILAASAACACAVRLLLSFDRAGAAEGSAGWDAVSALVQRWRGKTFLGLHPFPARPCALLVGLDVSGHPGRGSLAALLPRLAALRPPPHHAPHAPRLRVSLHLGELPGSEDEVAAALAWGPERVGHMCCLTPERARAVAAGGTGAGGAALELCPTSNAVTLGLGALAQHPTLGLFLASTAPALRIALCSDDCGVFGSALSSEYARVAQAFGLGWARVAALAEASFACGFAPPDVLQAARALAPLGGAAGGASTAAPAQQ